MSYFPPLRNTEYRVTVELLDIDRNTLLNPVIDPSGFLSSRDFGSFQVLQNVPAENPVGSGQVELVLTASEMDADNVTVRWVDPDGVWVSGMLTLQTVSRQFDDFLNNGEMAQEIWGVPMNELDATIAWDNVTVGEALVWLTMIAHNEFFQSQGLSVLNDNFGVQVSQAQITRSAGVFRREKWE